MTDPERLAKEVDDLLQSTLDEEADRLAAERKALTDLDRQVLRTHGEFQSTLEEFGQKFRALAEKANAPDIMAHSPATEQLLDLSQAGIAYLKAAYDEALMEWARARREDPQRVELADRAELLQELETTEQGQGPIDPGQGQQPGTSPPSDSGGDAAGGGDSSAPSP